MSSIRLRIKRKITPTSSLRIGFPIITPTPDETEKYANAQTEKKRERVIAVMRTLFRTSRTEVIRPSSRWSLSEDRYQEFRDYLRRDRSTATSNPPFSFCNFPVEENAALPDDTIMFVAPDRVINMNRPIYSGADYARDYQQEPIRPLPVPRDLSAEIVNANQQIVREFLIGYERPSYAQFLAYMLSATAAQHAALLNRVLTNGTPEDVFVHVDFDERFVRLTPRNEVQIRFSDYAQFSVRPGDTVTVIPQTRPRP